jgi:hypothetical protein
LYRSASTCTVWDTTNSFQAIGNLPGIRNSNANGCSANREVVVGLSYCSSNGGAIRWDAINGMQGYRAQKPGPKSLVRGDDLIKTPPLPAARSFESGRFVLAGQFGLGRSGKSVESNGRRGETTRLNLKQAVLLTRFLVIMAG